MSTVTRNEDSMKIRDGIFSYTIDRTDGPYAGEQLGVHVIEQENGSLLFGAGDALTADRVSEILENHEITLVIVEHGDPDHYGGLTESQDEFDMDVAVPTPDAGTLEENGIKVDYRLEDGIEIRSVRTIGIPGHSAGNMSYLYDDVLIAGDTVVGSNFERAAIADWSGPLAMIRPESNMDDALARRNVQRLLDYDFDVVLVTHGNNVLENGKAAVRRLIADLEEPDPT